MREWLKELRLQNEKSQKQVADEAEISESYYCQIETGQRNCPVDTAKKIAHVLNFSWQKFYEV